MEPTKETISSKIKEINKEITKLEKQIEKQEEDGIYDDSLYSAINRLEDERLELEKELDEL